jgi:ribosomal protein S18 acetylase RimI-like enzyme
LDDIKLREATEADLPVLAELWSHLDVFHRSLGLRFPHTSEAGEKWTNSFARTLGRFSFVWLAEKDGVPKAFLMARVKQSPAFLGGVQVGEISDLYVNESLQGSGVGTKLTELAMQKFSDLNVHSVEVQVLDGNEAGLGFWIKQGFNKDLTLVRKVLNPKPR